ncbi:MAG: hypothetical protein IMF11_20275 [Proteobacteria bacterium]|nr:hypothetical protein [Pseudomonadota bacterium]
MAKKKSDFPKRLYFYFDTEGNLMLQDCFEDCVSKEKDLVATYKLESVEVAYEKTEIITNPAP